MNIPLSSSTPSGVLHSSPHDAPEPFESSLIAAYTKFSSRLTPPFSIAIPSADDYAQLNLALAYAALSQPHLARIHLIHLHALVTDAYAAFTAALTTLLHRPRQLSPSTRSQLVHIASNLVAVDAAGLPTLILSLLRRIPVSDFSEQTLTFCIEILTLLLQSFDWIVQQPVVLASSVYVFLRLLADHYRLPVNHIAEKLKSLEVKFCVKVLYEHFDVCFEIGRDLIRLLLDLVHIPGIRQVWKDLLFDPGKFRVPKFSDVSQLYGRRTPPHYISLRISPEMESHLRFLLTYVKFGNQKRYQAWFANKYLSSFASETVVVDIVRFICCCFHPTNEIIRSDVISRWAVVGWLIWCCRKNYVEANVKLSLFYDWLFFDEKVDNIMNIEPAILLMVNSVPKYMDLTNTLLEFLITLVDNFDLERKDLIVHGVANSLDLLVKKGVVPSLKPLMDCKSIPTVLRERLANLAYCRSSALFCKNSEQSSVSLAAYVTLRSCNADKADTLSQDGNKRRRIFPIVPTEDGKKRLEQLH